MTLLHALQRISSLQSFQIEIPKHFSMNRRFTPTILSSGDEQLIGHEENPDAGQLVDDPSCR